MAKRREEKVSMREYHGRTESPEYEIWCGIKKRCFNQRSHAYRRYGGRGITMCQEWFRSFQAFYRDVGPRPFPDAEIDRINNDGNYEPGNVRWATPKQQSNNRKSNRFLTVDGVTKTLMQWGEETGLGWAAIKSRLDRGLSHKESVKRPLSARGRRGIAHSGLAGVTERNGRFRSLVRIRGKLIHLGSYSTAEEAHCVYLAAKVGMDG